MSVPYELTVLFSSDPAQGASPVGTDGSRFSIEMDSPLSLGDPDNLGRRPTAVSLAVTRASIWNTSPNISPEVGFANNIFPFRSGGNAYTIAVPEGLYSLSALDSYLSSQFVNLGLSAGLIRLAANDATQSSVIVFENAGDAVDFRPVSGGGLSGATLRTVLGFDAALYTAPSDGFSIQSPNPAAFNRVNSYLISSTAVNGLVVNSNTTGVLSQVPIDVPPGSQITYDPRNIIRVPCPELAYGGRQRWDFALLDQSGRPAPTGGEYWTFVVTIRYYLV